jgi:hypothetical protein
MADLGYGPITFTGIDILQKVGLKINNTPNPS